MIALPAGNFTEMVGKYLVEKTGMRLTPGMFQAFMVINESKDFVAGVVLTNYRSTDIDISCASETPAAWRPHVCRAIFTYIFVQLDCVRCTAITTKANRKARGFLESLGFQLEGNARLGYDGRRDALIYGMLRSECRFLAEKASDDEGRTEPAASPGPDGDGSGTEGREYVGGDYSGEPEPHQPNYAAG